MLALGRRLTKELGLDDSVDTLGRWMAHYVAELIHDAESARGDERSARMQACCDAILELWRHRHALQGGRRPFERMEPILRALASLDPDEEMPRYFRRERAAANVTDGDDEMASWLRTADMLDDAARLLIRHCLARAAHSVLAEAGEWVALADAAGADIDIEEPVFVQLAAEDHLLTDPTPGEEAQWELKDRVRRLEHFSAMAAALAVELQQQIAQGARSEG